MGEWRKIVDKPTYVMEKHDIGQIAGKDFITIDLTNYGIEPSAFHTYTIEHFLTFYANHADSVTKTHYIIRAHRRVLYDVVCDNSGNFYVFDKQIDNPYTIENGGVVYDMENDELNLIGTDDIIVNPQSSVGNLYLNIYNSVHSNPNIDPNPDIVLKIEHHMTSTKRVDPVTEE